MNTKLYGLECKEFAISSDSSFYFAHDAYSDTRSRLLEAMRQGEGFFVLTGAPGTGKTLLVDDLAARLASDGSIVGKVSHPLVDADELPLLVAFAFGIEAHALNTANVLTKLKEELIDKNPSRQSIIVLIDEAQSLSAAALQQLRLLFDLLAGRGYGVRVLLAGQERLRERLRHPECVELQRSIVASCRLEPLGSDEMRDYVAHVLKGAAWRGNPEIGAGALQLIYRHTNGVPRLIDLVVRRLLLHGSLDKVRVLGESDVKSAVEEMVQDYPDVALDTSKQAERLASSFGPLPSLDLRSLAAVGPREHPLQEREARPLRRHEPDVAVKSSTDRIRRLIRRNRIAAFGAIAAAAIFVPMFLVIDLDEKTVAPSAPPEASLRTKPNLAQRQYLPQSRPEREIQGSAASNRRLAPSNDKVVRALRDRVEEPRDAGPEPVLIAETTAFREARVESEVIRDPQNDVEALEASEVRNTVATSAIDGAEPSAEAPQVLGEITETDRFAEIAETAPSGDAQVASQNAREADEKVAALLRLADNAMAENRLTVPSDNNAYAHYQAALILDPENAEAKEGIQRIVQRYRELVTQRLNRGDRRTARLLASRGLKIAPRDPQLLSLAKQASRKSSRRKKPPAPRVAAEENETSELVEKLQEWFRSGDTSTSWFLDN